MTQKIGLGLLCVMMASAASAGTHADPGCTKPAPPPQTFFSELLALFSGPSNCGGGAAPLAAPEIDPASAMAGLTLMGAGLVVLRGRRQSR